MPSPMRSNQPSVRIDSSEMTRGSAMNGKSDFLTEPTSRTSYRRAASSLDRRAVRATPACPPRGPPRRAPREAQKVVSDSGPIVTSRDSPLVDRKRAHRFGEHLLAWYE